VLIEFDPDKNEWNIRERGIDFLLVEHFDWDTAIIIEDVRRDYGEVRLRAMGMIADKLHVLVYTMRSDILRVISLRRANDREETIYEKTRET